MNADGRCDELHGPLEELALGIADGEDRARVLEHVPDCDRCRVELERLSALADELLVLSPEQEPPPGFEVRVLRAVRPPERRRWSLRLAPVLASAALATVVTAGALLFAFHDERSLADHYRATLAEANGSSFGAVRLHDAAGAPAGTVFAYEGAPSWLVVTVAPDFRDQVDRAEIVTRNGRRVPLTSFRLASGAWGGALPVALDDVAAVHLVDGAGRSILVAYVKAGAWQPD